MNWLDRTIGWVAPETALRRVRARAALHAAARLYEGASTGRRTEGWKATGSSANWEIATAGTRLRDRSRDLVRNNPYALRAIAVMVANAVGVGITLGTKEAIGPVWEKWVRESDYAGEIDFYGQTALGARAMFESGEVLVVRRRLTAAETDRMVSGVPLKIQVLEADHIDSTKMGKVDGNIVISGVEVNPLGKRVAYWLHNQHPGDAPMFMPALTSQRVLAEDVIHLFEKASGRPGQLRGVPKLAASIMKLRDLDEYQEALLMKKKIEACFAAFVTTADDTKTLADKTREDEDSDATGGSKRIETLAPAMIHYLRPDEQVEFANPSSSAGEDVFSADQLHAIAAGAGCTYEQLTGDLSRVNYSSTRFGRQEFKALIEQIRWLTIVPMALERVYGWVEEAAYDAGKVRTRGYEHTWTPPRWEYVNPKEDVETDILELRARLASPSSKLRERGEDPVKVWKEIADDQDAMEKANIVPDYGLGGNASGDAGNTAPTDSTGKAQPGGVASSALDEHILAELRNLSKDAT